MLLAEDLLLLLTDDDTGKLIMAANEVELALGGANLVELTIAGRVDITGADEGKAGRLVVRDDSSTGDPVLDDALATVSKQSGKKPSSVVRPLSKKLSDRLYKSLVDRGILRAEDGKVLGLFPSRKWPTDDATHERELRARIEGALLQGVTPDVRTAALISLVQALRATPKVVDRKEHGLSRRELDARAKAIAEGSWGSAAVRSAIDEMMSAVLVAVVAGTVAGTTSS